ncbi:MAG TPA: deoxyribonuclease IV [Lacipirellulaceae bacterium]|nr:deoxyribonuclease IV [Lacipirellulaceae bacterium]
MPILGAHQSIAGGYYKAVERAKAVACDCVQIFTKNNNQWRAKELSDEDARLFKAALKQHGITHPLAHDSYLINLASPDPVLWKKSVDSFVMEMFRANRLGIRYLVTHPGAYTSGSEATGIATVVRALDEVHAQTRGIKTRCLLENTAGQGSCLGCRFEQLAEMIEKVRNPDLLGVCIDTCHLFAAGYPISTEKDYEQTMRALDKTVGRKLVRAFHLNDSAKPFGSRVDRHAHIGRGMIGKEAFRLLLNDRRFSKVPMYIETPKGEEKGKDLDAINLRALRRLILKPAG